MSFSLPQTHVLGPATPAPSKTTLPPPPPPPPTVTSVDTHTLTHTVLSTVISTVINDSPTILPGSSASFPPSNPTDTVVSPPNNGLTPGQGEQGSVPPPSSGIQDSLAAPIPTDPPNDPLAFSSESTSVDPFSSDASSAFVLSTVLVASTDSTSGVHTFTQVTTIASFRSSPTGGHKPNKGTRSPDGGSSASQNVGVIVMCVMAGVVVCAITLLGVWWCRRRRRLRGTNYEFSGYGTTTPGSSSWGQRFGRAFGRRLREPTDLSTERIAARYTISSFGGSTDRILTPTPFVGQRSSEALAEKPNPYAGNRIVQFQEPLADDNDSGGRARQRGEASTQRDRPPTYVTNSTGIATIATTLPMYSAYDPSPISELSEPNTPTSLLTPLSPAYGRDKARRSIARPRALATIGEKF